MKVFMGSDHRGFKLKEEVSTALSGMGYEVADLGDLVLDLNDDYTDFSLKVAEAVAGEKGAFGILLCGTGQGMAVSANKISGVRAALCWNAEIARFAREHEDANILCLPADYLGEMQALEIAEIFLRTGFSGGENYVRRLEKIKSLEVGGTNGR